MKLALVHDVRGTVMVEWLIAFLPVLLLVLGTTQLVLIAAARLVVQHAAGTGARAASVVLADDADRYSGEPLGTIAESGGALDRDALAILDVTSTTSAYADAPERPGPRLAAIRRAVSLPMSTLAPDDSQLTSVFGTEHRSLFGALGIRPISRAASALLSYDPVALAVTFPKAPGSPKLQAGVLRTKSVVVRVTYLFHCAVPLGAAALCDTLPALALLAEDDPEIRAALAELEHAPAAAAQSRLAASAAKFRLLRAEAEMPLQLPLHALATWGDI